MIYLCVKDFVSNIKEIKVCKDINFRTLKNLLPLLFKEHDYLNGVKIIQRKGGEEKSAGHNIALKTFRKRKYASLIIKEEMIEDVLFKFKKE